MNYTVGNAYESELSAYVNQGIKTYNDSKSIHHLASRNPGSKKFLSVAEYDADALIGGLLAQVFWQWIKIDELFIDQAYRRKGLGTKLVRKALELAANLGCHKALVYTFSFQAVGFYEHLGFDILSELKDYPPEASFYTMTKDLR